LSLAKCRVKCEACTEDQGCDNVLTDWSGQSGMSGEKIEAYGALEKCDLKLIITLQKYKLLFCSSGNPTIQKCKRLRKKIETRREVQELDVGNIMEEKGESS
jgi:thioredoxin-related protein